MAISFAVIGLSRLGAEDAQSQPESQAETNPASNQSTLIMTVITGRMEEWAILRKLSISKVDGTALSLVPGAKKAPMLTLAPGKRRLKVCIDHAENQQVDGVITLPADAGHKYVLSALLKGGLYHVFVYDVVSKSEWKQVVHKTISAPYTGLRDNWVGALPGSVMGPPGTGMPVQQRMIPRTR